MIEFVREPIDLNRVSTFCSMDRVGAVSLFVGITRRFTGNIETLCLEYEAYEQDEALRWGLHTRAEKHHRLARKRANQEPEE